MIVDVIIMAALPEEHAALQLMLRKIGRPNEGSHDGHFALYEIYTLESDLRVVLTQPTGQGQLNAAVASGRMLYDLHPRLVLLGGIAGCMGEDGGDFMLGDIVISDLIINYELEKIREAEIEQRPGDIQANQALIGLINERRNLWPGDFAGSLAPRPSADGKQPQLHVGNVFSGNQVLASGAVKREFLDRRPNAIAIEMETAGIAAMVKGMHFPERVLMVKSFTDWADGTKNDVWRGYACTASATFIEFLLQEIIPIHLRKSQGTSSADEDRQLFERRVTYAFDSFLRTQARSIPFLKEIARTICDQAIVEATTLAAVKISDESRYEAKIGTGHQFLLRARPLFRNAKRMVVTSLDSISTFWTDPLSKMVACDYIIAQSKGNPGGSVKRLFVFSSAESAHQHARVLDYHAKLFKDTFVCSRQRYERYLDRIAPGAREKYLKRDFAILECPTENGDQVFFSDLNADSFSIRTALFDSTEAEVDCRATFELFDEFSNIQAGVLECSTPARKC